MEKPLLSLHRIFVLIASLFLHAYYAEARIVTDMRGVEVEIPDMPQHVATIDDGFIESVMTHLGVIDRVKAIGSWAMKRDYRYSYENKDNEN